MARTIRLLPTGRALPFGGAAVRGTQSGRAAMVKDPEVYPWSSAAAHISGRGNHLVKVNPLLEMVGNWRDFLLMGVSKEEIERIRRHEKTGRALGDDGFVGKFEGALGRILQRQKPGRKKGDEQK